MLCPLLSICKKQVDLEMYINICSNVAKDAYKECDEYKKVASTLKTPSTWSSLLTITTT